MKEIKVGDKLVGKGRYYFDKLTVVNIDGKSVEVDHSAYSVNQKYHIEDLLKFYEQVN